MNSRLWAFSKRVESHVADRDGERSGRRKFGWKDKFSLFLTNQKSPFS